MSSAMIDTFRFSNKQTSEQYEQKNQLTRQKKQTSTHYNISVDHLIL